MKTKKPKARVTWGFNPVCRVVPSNKRYNRNIDKSQIRREMRVEGDCDK